LGSLIFAAAARASSNAFCACLSVRLRTVVKPEVPPAGTPVDRACSSARSAASRRCSSSGASMTATTWPLLTRWPASTRSSSSVPDEGALTVAAARAVTDPGASTTSSTVPRPT
jgi:hypothetical protein